jgi:hypothetical protein
MTIREYIFRERVSDPFADGSRDPPGDRDPPGRPGPRNRPVA